MRWEEKSVQYSETIWKKSSATQKNPSLVERPLPQREQGKKNRKHLGGKFCQQNDEVCLDANFTSTSDTQMGKFSLLALRMGKAPLFIISFDNP